VRTLLLLPLLLDSVLILQTSMTFETFEKDRGMRKRWQNETG
jgi:hypothetical protein